MSLAGLSTEYSGQRSGVFWLAMRMGALTVLTLGLYRFWMKTRLRRYFWSAVRPGGIPLEYTGDPWEKLLGFLFAVVILAFYIGVVNLILMFFSFTLFQTNFIAYALSFVGVLPLIFFAQYRARRYVLARTRWRGVRFGLEPGAWGYAWRAAVHWLITLASFGILWPRKTFWLEKYRTDRTFFGDQKLEQGGRWTMLLGAMKHVYIGGLLSVLISAAALGLENPALFGLLTLSVTYMLIGIAFWRAHAFRRLTENKTIGGVRLTNAARGGRVLGIYAGGYVLAGLTFLAGVASVSLVFAVFTATTFGIQDLMAALEGVEGAKQVPLWLMTTYGVASYFTLFLFWGAARLAFVTLPLVRHFARTTGLTNTLELALINQRSRDEFTEAEGFADALDVGAAL